MSIQNIQDRCIMRRYKLLTIAMPVVADQIHQQANPHTSLPEREIKEGEKERERVCVCMGVCVCVRMRRENGFVQMDQGKLCDCNAGKRTDWREKKNTKQRLEMRHVYTPIKERTEYDHVILFYREQGALKHVPSHTPPTSE